MHMQAKCTPPSRHHSVSSAALAARACAPGCTRPRAQSAGCSPRSGSHTTHSRSPAGAPAAVTGLCAGVRKLTRAITQLVSPWHRWKPCSSHGHVMTAQNCYHKCMKPVTAGVGQVAGCPAPAHLTRWNQNRLRRVSRRARGRSSRDTAPWMLCRSATMCRHPSSAT